MAGSKLGAKAIQQVREVVRRVLGEHRNELTPRRGRKRGRNDRLRGTWVTAVTGPATVTSTPTTALVDLLEIDSAQTDDRLMERTPVNQVTATIYDPAFSAAAGEYVRLARHNGVWEPISSGGGGTSTTCHTIRFTIVTADCDLKEAYVSVDQKNCGCTAVPEIDGSGNLYVYDRLLCWLNEPPDDLVGRKGMAVRMVDSDVDDYEGCDWEITYICPSENNCL